MNLLDPCLRHKRWRNKLPDLEKDTSSLDSHQRQRSNLPFFEWSPYPFSSAVFLLSSAFLDLWSEKNKNETALRDFQCSFIKKLMNNFFYITAHIIAHIAHIWHMGSPHLLNDPNSTSKISKGSTKHYFHWENDQNT